MDQQPAVHRSPLDKRLLVLLGVIAVLLILLLLLSMLLGQAGSAGNGGSSGTAETVRGTSPGTRTSVGTSSADSSSESPAVAGSRTTKQTRKLKSTNGSKGSEGSAGSPSTKTPKGVVGGTQFFGVKSEGQSFVYVIDCSGSMQGKPLQRAKQELLRSIEALSDKQFFYLIFFGSNAYPMYFPDTTNGGLVQGTKENKSKAKRWVEQFTVKGGTDPYEALKTAIALYPDAIYLLSDGEFSESVLDLITSGKPSLSEAKLSVVKINTVSFINRRGEPLLRKIAKRTGGHYRFVP